MAVTWGDPLARPRRATSTMANGLQRVRMEMRRGTATFNSRMGLQTHIWHYTSDGGASGATIEVIEATVGVPTEVTWRSELTGTSLAQLLSIGTRVGMEEPHMLAVPHNVVHLHGARVNGTSDGHPMRFMHPGEGAIYRYPNRQAAATLWFHDHCMDVTRLNVYAGLFGGYVLRDPLEDTLLPKDAFEHLLVLQDKSFTASGRWLRYRQRVTASEVVPEFVGDLPVVNGQVWPVMSARPRVYRLRLLNGANTRVFALTLRAVPTGSDPAAADAAAATGAPVPLWVIGSDGGFLPAPVRPPGDELLIAPGERYDVLVDLAPVAGRTLVWCNRASIPFGDLSLPATDPLATILRVDVATTIGSGTGVHTNNHDPATATLPPYHDPLWATLPPPPGDAAFPAIRAAVDAVPIGAAPVPITVAGQPPITLRRFVLAESPMHMPTMPAGRQAPNVTINGVGWSTATPMAVDRDAVEVWEFINTTPDTHPMHIHLVQFRVLERVALTLDAAGDTVQPPAYAVPRATAAIDPSETGWKDTVRCAPGEATRVIARFDGGAGEYVAHCHILEHEDMGMMLPVTVG